MQFDKPSKRLFERKLKTIPWIEALPPSFAIAVASGLLISQGGILEGIIMELVASSSAILQYHNLVAEKVPDVSN